MKVDGLFHCQVYWPNHLEQMIPQFVNEPIISTHAVWASKRDRYGHFNIPNTINTTETYIFEAEVRRGELVKFVLRQKYNEQTDICIVLKRKNKKHDWSIATAWLNRRGDRHTTLDRTRYCIRG